MTVNAENINKTIDTIRNEGEVIFSMTVWGDSDCPLDSHETGFTINDVEITGEEAPIYNLCGTAACIAGFAVMAEQKHNKLDGLGIHCRAADFLGIDDFQSNALFYPSEIEPGISGFGASRKQAIKVLEHLRDTGNVDWTVAANVK